MNVGTYYLEYNSHPYAEFNNIISKYEEFTELIRFIYSYNMIFHLLEFFRQANIPI